MPVADAKVRLSIGTRIAFGGPVPLRDQLRYLQDLEDMNLLHIVGGGRADSQSGVYSAMGLVAEHTRWAKVGPLVDNPHTRLPTVAAGEITTIQDISGGGHSSAWALAADKPEPRCDSTISPQPPCPNTVSTRRR